MLDMWRYIHARTVVRVMARLRGPVPDRSAELQAFLRRTIESRGGVFSILQVGAYDGVSNDAVHGVLDRYPEVRAVLLEPQPGPFDALQKRWQGVSRIVPIQAALSDSTGERPLYVIADGYKHWHPYPDQVASFYRSRVEAACSRYVWRPSADFISSIPVQTLDWPTLVRRYGRFDLVAIDTEGYDAEVLDQIDFSREPPDVILFEHVLLARTVRARAEARLRTSGYALSRVNVYDTLATRTGSGLAGF